jgi:hypothetical protein
MIGGRTTAPVSTATVPSGRLARRARTVLTGCRTATRVIEEGRQRLVRAGRVCRRIGPGLLAQVRVGVAPCVLGPSAAVRVVQVPLAGAGQIAPDRLGTAQAGLGPSAMGRDDLERLTVRVVLVAVSRKTIGQGDLRVISPPRQSDVRPRCARRVAPALPSPSVSRLLPGSASPGWMRDPSGPRQKRPPHAHGRKSNRQLSQLDEVGQ